MEKLKEKREWPERQKRKGGGGCRGSHLQLTTTSRVKTRQVEKEGADFGRSRSGGTTPALFSPCFPPRSSFFQRIMQRKCWQRPPYPLLNLSFFLSLLISFSFSFPPSPHSPPPRSFLLLLLHFSAPPPFLMPDTTKSATCGLNGNQTSTPFFSSLQASPLYT